jgi:diaminopimelate epimerase
MRISFTKMQGAGNDFVVLDETRARWGLSAVQYRFLADRHFGVGADQILSVLPSPGAGLDFEYVIHNADGAEVEQCGNGARCFAVFVREQRLSDKATLRVKTMKGEIALQLGADGRVTVNMGLPVFAPDAIPFRTDDLAPQPQGDYETWPLSVEVPGPPTALAVAIVSMGNPHAVLVVNDVNTTPVESLGPAVQSHARFAQGVNVGFMQVISRTQVGLRVYERGAGETLACGTGACAAVVAGIRLGLLDSPVTVQARGGQMSIAWAGDNAPVMMTGPAVTVFHGEINIPDPL